MRYLSVCSGIEAASVAWHPLGWEPVAFAEIEPFPSAVLAHRYPTVPNYGDITKFKEWGIEPGTIDILVGGTPCQSFSVAGLRKGLSDPRGNLMLTFGAIADYLRPTWIVWENVPGVLSSNRGRDFGTFLGMLGELGFGFSYRIHDAQYHGVAQRRRRVFVVGYLGDWRRAASVLFESESLSWHPAPSRQEGKGFTAVTGTLAANGGGTNRPAGNCNELDFCIPTRSHWDGDYPHPTLNQSAKGSGGVGASNQELFIQRGAYLAPAIMAHGQANAETRDDGGAPSLTCNLEAPIVAHTLRGRGFDASEDGTGRGTPLVPVAFPATLSGTQCASTENLSPSLGAKNPMAVTFEPRFARNGRGAPSEIVPPLKAQSGQTGKGDAAPLVVFAQNTRDEVREMNLVGALAAQPRMKQTSYIRAETAVRRLTPRECERLQGFPDDWTLIPWKGRPAEDCPDGPRYKACGNSMAVPVMRWIGERIEKVRAMTFKEDDRNA